MTLHQATEGDFEVAVKIAYRNLVAGSSKQPQTPRNPHVEDIIQS
jgi:hypothetical protein